MVFVRDIRRLHLSQTVVLESLTTTTIGSSRAFFLENAVSTSFQFLQLSSLHASSLTFLPFPPPWPSIHIRQTQNHRAKDVQYIAQSTVTLPDGADLWMMGRDLGVGNPGDVFHVRPKLFFFFFYSFFFCC